MEITEEHTYTMEIGPYYASKIWDWAYPSGHAPPSSTPVLKAIDKPLFCPQDPVLESRRSSDSSTSSISSTPSLYTNTNTNQPSLATGPQIPKPTLRNWNLESMPAWAKSLPKEVFGGDGARDMGMVLFPTHSAPRRLLERKKGGIKRAGHPMLKLRVEERDTYRPLDLESEL